MPFTKVYNGAGSGATAGDYGDSRNWELISIRNAKYAWTASGSGTNEYYVRTAAGANPGFQASPPTSNGVYINGSAATEGTLGALTAGQWGYGDNDTLGYSTVYVRLSDGADPDSKTADHVQFRQIPQATEHVRIPAGAGNISSNLDQSAVAIGDFIVEDGYESTIGSSTGSLLIDPDRFEFSATSGQAFIDIGTANISPVIHSTGPADPGERGLYLRGSNMATLDIRGGLLGIASLPGETATVATLRVMQERADVWIGNGVTLTTLHMFAGLASLRTGATTIIIYGGTLTAQENGAITTLTMYGGQFNYNTSGNITTVNLHGGTLDEIQNGIARTISTLNLYRGVSNIYWNKEAVTHTTITPQESFNLSMTQ